MKGLFYLIFLCLFFHQCQNELFNNQLNMYLWGPTPSTCPPPDQSADLEISGPPCTTGFEVSPLWIDIYPEPGNYMFLG